MPRRSTLRTPPPAPCSRTTGSTATPDTRLGRLIALAVPTAILLAGCAADATDAPTAPALPDGVTVTLIQQRTDVAERMAQVRIRNASDEPFAFDSLTMRDERFAEPVVRAEPESIAPGRTVELRIALPAAACGAAGSGQRTITFAQDDATEAVADLTSADDFTAGLLERDCLRAEVERTAVLEWTEFVPSPPGAPATAVLSVRPTGRSGTVEIAAVRSTNLLQFEGRVASYPVGLVIDGDAAATRLEIPLVPQRCDPHVVAEDKRGTVFTLDIARPREGIIEVPMSPELKARVLAWVVSWCRMGE